MSCEHSTGLTGDLFTTRYRLIYPLMYRTPKGRQLYLNMYQNYIRTKHQRLNVVINLSNGTTVRIQLAFCGFSTEGNQIFESLYYSYICLYRSIHLYVFIGSK